MSHYSGNDMTFTAEPSTALRVGAEIVDTLTGQVQSSFVISGTMEGTNTIEKQAYLRIKIPGAFVVSNYDRVASTCTRLTGFSDEISCSFEEVSMPALGNYLIVRGGFDSETFTDKDFSLSIAEVKNPFTTQETDSFEMEIYDRVGGLMYTSNNEVKLRMSASNFAFVHVESLSPANGVETIYTVTITLGVDTSQSAKILMQVPDEISFADQSGASICRGT